MSMNEMTLLKLLGLGSDGPPPKMAPADATAVARNSGAMKPMSLPDAAGTDTTALKSRILESSILTPYPTFWRDSSDFAQQAKREGEEKTLSARTDSLDTVRNLLEMLKTASKQSGQRKVP